MFYKDYNILNIWWFLLLNRLLQRFYILKHRKKNLIVQRILQSIFGSIKRSVKYQLNMNVELINQIYQMLFLLWKCRLKFIFAKFVYANKEYRKQTTHKRIVGWFLLLQGQLVKIICLKKRNSFFAELYVFLQKVQLIKMANSKARWVYFNL